MTDGPHLLFPCGHKIDLSERNPIDPFRCPRCEPMTSLLYMICDADGLAITDGVPAEAARQIAQSIADRRGEPIYLSGYVLDEGQPMWEGEDEEFLPRKVS